MLFEPDIKPKGVIHIGAHTGEELPIYWGWGTKVLWIEGQAHLAEALRDKGRPARASRSPLSPIPSRWKLHRSSVYDRMLVFVYDL